jgi:hypothetical protein
MMAPGRLLGRLDVRFRRKSGPPKFHDRRRMQCYRLFA